MSSEQSSDSNAVEVDGIRFETVVPERVLSIPKKNVVQKLLYVLQCLSPTLPQHPYPSVSVQIGLRITNNTSTPLRFSFYFTLSPELIGVDGQIPLEGGWFSTTAPIESDFPSIMAGESATFFPDARIFWLWGNQFGLSLATGNGGTVSFQPLKLGTYQFRFTYNNPNSVETSYGSASTDKTLIEELWTGHVPTPFVEFCLVKS
ncbi:MAG: hypothetical protein KME06_06625 [Kastovskya adunca ATA6-11-RM4]|jgi:hypothetical protein|nr:hypothetical protein [Kastovskya adunca ATA6-11-RM4]